MGHPWGISDVGVVSSKGGLSGVGMRRGGKDDPAMIGPCLCGGCKNCLIAQGLWWEDQEADVDDWQAPASEDEGLFEAPPDNSGLPDETFDDGDN